MQYFFNNIKLSIKDRWYLTVEFVGKGDPFTYWLLFLKVFEG